jgi:hypothetical protein
MFARSAPGRLHWRGPVATEALRRSPSPPSRLGHCCPLRTDRMAAPCLRLFSALLAPPAGIPPLRVRSRFAASRPVPPPPPSKRGFPVPYRRLPFPSGFRFSYTGWVTRGSTIAAGTYLLSRTHCLGSASGRIPTPGDTPPRDIAPACLLRSPATDFDSRAHYQRAENLRVTLRKSLSVGCPRLACSPRLGSGDLSLLVARDRWAQKEKRKCT